MDPIYRTPLDRFLDWLWDIFTHFVMNGGR